jgi:hypothetical protein
MKTQTSKTKGFSSKLHFNSETCSILVKAQNGEIPVAALQKFDLDSKDVSQFLARELVFLHSAAEGAKMHTLAVLFYELHSSLLETTKQNAPFWSASKSRGSTRHQIERSSDQLGV